MIIIKNIKVSYSKIKRVINSLNLTITKNNIHGIVGLNGTGKTTLLNAIYGLKKIDSGKILFNNEKLSKKQISYLPTENFFYSNITGKEYLDLFKNKSFDIDKWNKLFHLPLDHIVDNYSTGMKKKLALFGVLKENKPILILDEPFNGLDIEMNRIIRMVLLMLKNTGKTIIITSHIMETLTNLCDYIHLLENGGIKCSKEKEEFIEFEREVFKSIENKNAILISELIK